LPPISHLVERVADNRGEQLVEQAREQGIVVLTRIGCTGDAEQVGLKQVAQRKTRKPEQVRRSDA
jgi:hypothetical protein